MANEHNWVYNYETSIDVRFRCTKEPGPPPVEIYFVKPWLGSPAAVWVGPPLIPDILKLLLWTTPPNPDQYIGPCSVP